MKNNFSPEKRLEDILICWQHILTVTYVNVFSPTSLNSFNYLLIIKIAWKIPVPEESLLLKIKEKTGRWIWPSGGEDKMNSDQISIRYGRLIRNDGSSRLLGDKTLKLRKSHHWFVCWIVDVYKALIIYWPEHFRRCEVWFKHLSVEGTRDNDKVIDELFYNIQHWMTSGYTRRR